MKLKLAPFYSFCDGLFLAVPVLSGFKVIVKTPAIVRGFYRNGFKIYFALVLVKRSYKTEHAASEELRLHGLEVTYSTSQSIYSALQPI